MQASGIPPYGGGELESLAREALFEWEHITWLELLAELRALREGLLRKDANQLVHDESFEEDPTVDEEKAAMECFRRKFSILEKCIKVNAVVAPIRAQLENQIRSKDTVKLEVESDKLQEVL